MAKHTEVEVAELPDCDVCKQRGIKKPAYADANLRLRGSGGPWGYVCEECFKYFNCQLGLGLGQRLILKGAVVQ